MGFEPIERHILSVSGLPVASHLHGDHPLVENKKLQNKKKPQGAVSREREIRTLTKQFLRLLPLPLGYFSMNLRIPH